MNGSGPQKRNVSLGGKPDISTFPCAVTLDVADPKPWFAWALPRRPSTTFLGKDNLDSDIRMCISKTMWTDTAVNWQSSVDEIENVYGHPTAEYSGTDRGGTWQRLVFCRY
jgi:hypothetical protein